MNAARNSARDLIARAMPWVSPSVQADLRRVDAVLEKLIEAAGLSIAIGDDRLDAALALADDCVTCPHCGGSGSVERRHPSGDPQLDTDVTCGECGGSGEFAP